MIHRLLARTCTRAIVMVAVWLAPAVAAGQTPDGVRNTTATTTWTAPLTFDGKPDLNGVWVNRTATPLERPEALKGRPLLTDAEVVQLKARADRIFKNANSDAPVWDLLFLAALADVQQYRNPNSTQTVGLDDSIVEREFDNRTSLITDPPDGRIPPLTPEGQRRQAANAARGFNIPWGPVSIRRPNRDRLPQPGYRFRRVRRNSRMVLGASRGAFPDSVGRRPTPVTIRSYRRPATS